MLIEIKNRVLFIDDIYKEKILNNNVKSIFDKYFMDYVNNEIIQVIKIVKDRKYTKTDGRKNIYYTISVKYNSYINSCTEHEFNYRLKEKLLFELNKDFLEKNKLDTFRINTKEKIAEYILNKLSKKFKIEKLNAKCYDNYITINIYYPRINISNGSHKHTIRGLDVQFIFKTRYNNGKLYYVTLSNIHVKRNIYTAGEFNKGYIHSHMKKFLNASTLDMSDMCFGATELKELINKNMYTENDIIFIILNFDKYLRWESLEGVPYIKITEIKEYYISNTHNNIDKNDEEVKNIINNLYINLINHIESDMGIDNMKIAFNEDNIIFCNLYEYIRNTLTQMILNDKDVDIEKYISKKILLYRDENLNEGTFVNTYDKMGKPSSSKIKILRCPDSDIKDSMEKCVNSYVAELMYNKIKKTLLNVLFSNNKFLINKLNK